MSSTPILPKDDDDDLLAAEYVMGLLDLQDRALVESRLRHEPHLVARVQDWENHFAGLNDGYDEAAAPDLMPQIEARLFPTPPRRRFLGTLLTWGAAATAAFAVLAYLAVTPPAPSLTATLTADAGNLRFEAVITEGRLTITRVSGDAAGSDRSHELWIIAGDNPPVSLGLLPDSTRTITLPGASPGAVLAVSLEQSGGSPDGKPNGPIVAEGTLTAAI